MKEAETLLARASGHQALSWWANTDGSYFQQHHIPVEHSFLYTAQNPTMQRAREICSILLSDL